MKWRALYILVGILQSMNAWAQTPADELSLEPIYVTRDRPSDAPGLVLVLDETAIASKSADHPAEVVNVLPAVNIQMNSGQEHLIALRSPVLTGGAGQGSFLILENGLPTRSSAFGNVNALFEPVHELATDLEVVVGPASAKYGSNAVHGLLNFGLPRPGERASHLHVAASSLGRQKLDATYQPTEQALIGIAVQHDSGWRDSTGVDQQKLYLAGSFELAGWDGLAWLTATNLNQETGDFIQGQNAFRDRDIARSNDDADAFRDAKSARAAVQFVRNSEAVQWRITPYARWQEMEFRQHFLPFRGLEENGHSAFGIQTRGDWSAGDQAIVRFGFDADFASGYLVETQDLESFGPFPQGIHYDYDVDTDVFAVWSEIDADLSEKLSVLLGLRAESHSYDYETSAPVGINGRFNVPANRSDEFEFLTPKLGAVYALSDQTDLFANIARGARAPQASDLYRLQDQQLPGEVDIETLDSVEIGARGSFGADAWGRYQVAVYFAEKDNFFFRDADGLNVIDGTTEHAGVDVLLELNPREDLSIRTSVSWSDQIYTFDRAANGIQDGNQIDTAPEWLADVSAAWQVTDRWGVRGEAEYIGEYFTDPANTQDYPGHVLFHAATEFQITETLQFYAKVRNLFDLKYADRADFAFGSERFFPGEPLNLTLGFRKTFDD